MNELKIMMEKLGAPQTHLGLKDMIKVEINQYLNQFKSNIYFVAISLTILKELKDNVSRLFNPDFDFRCTFN